jgi:outer membrane protein assembly factor BamD
MNTSLLSRALRALSVSALGVLLLLASCTSFRSSNVVPRTVDEVYSFGVDEFKRGNYAYATKLFDIIKLQYPASKYADDAQYYLAEINFAKGEFILAAYNYNQVRRTFPNSDYTKICAYKAALSNLRMSPKQDRDQDYTKQAIRAFAEFQALYPNDSLAKESGLRIRELRNKLAEHDFNTAELYIKLYDPRAAIVYYDLVLSGHAESDYAEPALAGKIAMQLRIKKYVEAKESIRLYRQQYPAGKLAAEVDGHAAKLAESTKQS